MLKKVLIVLGVVFILIQFIRPERNLSNDLTYDITTQYSVPVEVSDILKGACYDCHSNNTQYPWYSNIQPVMWWLSGHISEAKKHINYSDFTNLPIATQIHKLEETIEQIESHEMPLESYTYMGLHKEAKITDEQRKIVIDWARAQIELFKTNSPSGSF